MNYLKLYISIICNAENREISGYNEKHHIIPRSMGGSDASWNIVRLSLREHYICHQLLVKIYENESPNQIFAVEAFYANDRTKKIDLKRMPRWIRRRLAHRRAEMNRLTVR